ncbi:MAG: NAD(P)/FAD-dependent oxidoreductase [Spirochaetota bacterium]
MKEEYINYDALILGAGPAGLTAAVFAVDKGMNIALVEGLKAGGQPRNLYPDKPVYNYPGYPEISGGELAEKMVEQTRRKNIPLFEDTPIEQMDRDGDRFILRGVNVRYRARGLIIASGMGLFKPRCLEVPGEKELENNGVYYGLSNLTEWVGKSVIVIGGGNSAVDNALLLYCNRAMVTVVHVLSRFQAEDASCNKLVSTGVPIFLERRVLGFEKAVDGKILTRMEHAKDGSLRELISDRVLINIGLKTDTGFLKNLPIEMEGRHIKVNTEMHTSITGIFACGDAVSYQGKVRLIVTAIGEAATAVNSLARYLKSLKREENA